MRVLDRVTCVFSDDNLPLLFVIFASITGLCFSILMPPFQIPDEPAHFFRAWGVSSGRLVPRRLTSIPKSIIEISAEADKVRADSNLRPITESDIADLMRLRLNAKDEVSETNPAANLYTPVPYLLEAMAFDLLRPLHLSVLIDLEVARVINLTGYVALTGLAMWLLPDFRLQLFCVACLPMALHQAASLSADSLTMASSFLLAAYMFRMAFSPAIQTIQRPQQSAMLASVLFASLCKFNIWPIFLFLLIPANKFRTRKSRWLMFAELLVVTIAVAALWNYLNVRNIEFYQSHKLRMQENVEANYSFAYEHPVLLGHLFFHSWQSYWYEYMEMFVGTFAWLNFPAPEWVVWGYVVLLAFVSVFHRRIQIGLSGRMLLAAITVASALSIFVLLWGFEATPDVIRSVLMDQTGVRSPGIQGRYFIPLALPLMVCLSTIRIRQQRFIAIPAVLFVGIADAASLLLIKHHFYC